MTVRFSYRFLISVIFITCVLASGRIVYAIPYTNLFNPYDILLFRPPNPCTTFDLSITYEGAIRARGFQTDPDDMSINRTDIQTGSFSRPVNVLQLWQDRQSIEGANAACQGTVTPGLDDEDIMRSIQVTGNLHVPVNLMLSGQLVLTDHFSLGVYLPLYMMELTNINWHNAIPASTSTSPNINQVLGRLEKCGQFDLRTSWKRQGIGDMAALLWWTNDFPQRKEWLKGVHVGLRGGLTFPTGLNPDLGRLFALPFGNNSGVGLLFGGTLELCFGAHISLGLDGEFLHLFGSKKERRIQINENETDLLFVTKELTFAHPGFLQHYTLYLRAEDLFARGLSTTLAYQHTRQHETHISPNSPAFDIVNVNNAESLLDWTTHSIIWLADYTFGFSHQDSWLPHATLFLKYGFNGKRALLFDTVGIQLGINY